MCRNELRLGVITNSESLSDIRKAYLKTSFNFENISNYQSQCFRYHISDIVPDIRKAFRICYDASPYTTNNWCDKHRLWYESLI